MVGDGSELTILKSTINKSTFEARDDLAPTGDFAICVVDSSQLHYKDGVIKLDSDSQLGGTGVVALGHNTTAHITGVAIDGLTAMLGLGAVDEAQVYAENIGFRSDALLPTAFKATGRGFVYVSDSAARAYSIFSAHTAGSIHAYNVTGVADHGVPITVSDEGVVFAHNCELAGDHGLVTAAPPSLSPTSSGSPLSIYLSHSKLTTTSPYAVAFNLQDNSDLHIVSTNLTSASERLATVSCATVTCEDKFTVAFTVIDSDLTGEIAIQSGAAETYLRLQGSAKWNGALARFDKRDDTLDLSADFQRQVAPLTPVDLYLDETAHWEVASTSWVRNLISADPSLANVYAGPGVTVFYDAAAERNGYLQGQAFKLHGGGVAEPFGELHGQKEDRLEDQEKLDKEHQEGLDKEHQGEFDEQQQGELDEEQQGGLDEENWEEFDDEVEA